MSKAKKLIELTSHVQDFHQRVEDGQRQMQKELHGADLPYPDEISSKLPHYSKHKAKRKDGKYEIEDGENNPKEED